MTTLQLTDHINIDRPNYCLTLDDSVVLVLNIKSRVDKQDKDLALSLKD